jgi:hypothetical protein
MPHVYIMYLKNIFDTAVKLIKFYSSKVLVTLLWKLSIAYMLSSFINSVAKLAVSSIKLQA